MTSKHLLHTLKIITFEMLKIPFSTIDHYFTDN